MSGADARIFPAAFRAATYQVGKPDVKHVLFVYLLLNLSRSVPEPDSAPEQPASLSNPSPVDESAAPPAVPPAEPGKSPTDVVEDEPLTPELVEEEAIRADFVLRWAVVLLAFLLGSTRITETSALVHIKAGQYLATHGVLPPALDVFSYTAEDRPWTNLTWGFDLLAAAIYAIGSFAGLSVVKAVAIAVAFWLIGRVSLPGIPTWWGSICGVVAILGCHLRFSADPDMVTIFGMALALTILHGWREFQSAKWLWLYVPLMIVWCNLDGRAWLGLVLLLLYAAGDGLGAML